ncbi:paraquat-inducible protein A [Endozoicomonas sp.]|uniref:paraquat-inducible protein A n=1 Tax=Endozoicomonas sp. TaxID=1892382 RepID=UPI00383B0E26
MTFQKLILPLMMVISLGLLIPGLTQPMITMKADLDHQAMLNEGKKIVQQQSLHPAMASLATQFLDSIEVKGTSRVYEKTRSILGTAEDLWKGGYHLVALLIVTFSLLAPAFKLGCLLLANFLKKNHKLLSINSFLSKWSMADVFAIGVLIASLAANGSAVENALIQFEAQLHSGFYWFAGYCLISNFMGQLAEKCCIYNKPT